MNRKHITIASLIAVAALTSTYIFWPVETPAKEAQVDPATKSAKLFDRMTANAPQFMGSTVDTRTVINGIKVPPMPDKKVNNATIAGVDSDNNGIRDDIDRYIAENFGNDTRMLLLAQNSAHILQKALVNPTKENVYAESKDVVCGARVAVSAGDPSVATYEMMHPLRLKLSDLERKMINSSGRGQAYARAFAGTGSEFGIKDCAGYIAPR